LSITEGVAPGVAGEAEGDAEAVVVSVVVVVVSLEPQPVRAKARPNAATTNSLLEMWDLSTNKLYPTPENS
jgi:hypothetical protein